MKKLILLVLFFAFIQCNAQTLSNVTNIFTMEGTWEANYVSVKTGQVLHKSDYVSFQFINDTIPTLCVFTIHSDAGGKGNITTNIIIDSTNIIFDEPEYYGRTCKVLQYENLSVSFTYYRGLKELSIWIMDTNRATDKVLIYYKLNHKI